MRKPCLLLGAFLAPCAAHAQIVAAPTAPANQRPTVLQAANGVPQIDIQTPSAAGVSRNTYSQFDVQRPGAILNNSRTNVQTQLGGWVQGNPWLAAGSARVILNEVQSSNPSLLGGYVEVAGSRAQVVIANPAGVTCDGCGFINASRATLTTGTPIVNGGSLDGYRVQGGTIAITGAGMDASTTDTADLIGRAVQVNAGIWANHLKVTTGPNQVDADNGAATPIAGSGSTPAYALDVAALGGMYAGKIVLVGTEAGVGVRNAGTIGASAGDVIVTVDGRLENAGRITATAHVTIDGTAGIANSGTIYAQGNAALGTLGTLDNSGTIAAQGDVSLAATGAGGRIVGAAGSVLGAGIGADGSVGGLGTLSVEATGDILARGLNLSGGDQSFAAQNIDLTGSDNGARNIVWTASAGDIDATGATVAAAQTLTIAAGGALRTDRAGIAAAQIGIAAGDWSNVGGTLGASGNLAAAVRSLDNARGEITAGQDLGIAAARAVANGGGLIAAIGNVDIGGSRIDNVLGTIASTQGRTNVAADVGTIDNTGGRIEAAQSLVLASRGLVNADGIVVAGSIALDTRGDAFDNTRGIVAATGALDGGTLVVQSGTLNNAAGLIQAAGKLDIVGTTLANTQGGIIVGAGSLELAGTSLDNRGGQILAQNDIGIALGGGALDNTGSLIRSGGTLTIAADSLVNANTQGADQGLEGNGIAITARQTDNRSGAIRANTTATLTGTASLDNSAGRIEAGTVLTLQDANLAAKTLSIANTGGTLVAGQDLVVDAASLGGDGALLSLGDLSAKLTQSYTHTGQFQANGAARLETAGTLTNRATLQGGTSLTLQAAALDNQSAGQILGGDLAIAVTGTLTNRGLIDGGEARIAAATLNNLGTGRIYGDHLAIAATTLTNQAESGTAPVIAARSRLDLGATTIQNREHALLFSAGDMKIGGALDANGYATGTAGSLANASATIESLGSLAISAGSIANTNEHFATQVVQTSSAAVNEYDGGGGRYTSAYYYGCVRDALFCAMIGGAGYQYWYHYSFTRTVTETQVAMSDPARIFSGGAMNLAGTTLLNDKSQIVAGGTLTASLGSLTNTDVTGTRTTTDVGTSTYYWPYQPSGSGNDYTKSSTAGYAPAPSTQSLSLSPTLYRQNTAPAGSGTVLAALATGSVAASLDAVAAPAGAARTVAPVVQVPAGQGRVVGTGGIDLALPASSLFHVAAGTSYLIETDPRFASYRAWLGSDFMLQALALDPALTQKRLGDGFYEQKLIREQVASLTGRRFLDGYASDEAQYRALMEAGVTFARAHQLVPGVALTAEQMAQLTSDIVWLVEQTVALPDGTTTKALVPQVYVRLKDGDLAPTGALLAGDSLDLNLTGDLRNGGTLLGRNVLSLAADNVANLGRIQGGSVSLAARQDILNLGGTIQAGDSLAIAAGRDLTVQSTTRSNANANGSNTTLDRIAGLYVTNPGGTLLASAGRDMNLIAATLQSRGSATLLAGNDLKLGTVTESNSNTVVWDARNRLAESRSREVGTSIQTQGDLTLAAGRDVAVRAGQASSEQGALTVQAGRDVTIASGEAAAQRDEAHYQEAQGGGLFAGKETETHNSASSRTTALASSLGGRTVDLRAGRDIGIKGSSVVSDQGTALTAGNDVKIEAATNTDTSSSFEAKSRSGVSFGGGGLFIGTRKQSTEAQEGGTTAAASTVGSTRGDVTIRAGNAYAQTGSDVLTPGGSIDVEAKTVDIREARNTRSSSTTTKSEQSGLSIGVSIPIVTAARNAVREVRTAVASNDNRLRQLGNAVMALDDATAVKSGILETIPHGYERDGILGAVKASGASLNVSLGTSKSVSTTSLSSDTAAGSRIAVGKDIAIRATDGDLTAQGSTLSAANDAILSATGNIKLLAAQNTASSRTSNSSSSASIGASVGISANGIGVSVNASASKSSGSSEERSTTHTNAKVSAGTQSAGAGGTASLSSGENTTLKGAVVEGNQVIASVGGNLAIESLQDTSSYRSKQQSAGVSVSVPIIGGGAPGGSLSANRAKASGDYASVIEQSGIQAGDAGFQVSVANNTDLKGAVIAGGAADKNRLTTGTLTTSDIANRASSDAQSDGINLTQDLFGKYGAVRTLASSAYQHVSDTASIGSLTRAAIAQGAINVTTTDAVKRAASEAAAQNLSRDTRQANQPLAKIDARAMEQKVAAAAQQRAADVALVTRVTDDAYRVMFREAPRFYKATCAAGDDCINNPAKVKIEPVTGTPQEIQAQIAANTDPNTVLAVNGIQNSIERGVELAFQNAAPIRVDSNGNQIQDPTKPTTIYLMHYQPANSTVGELLVSGYEKLLTSVDRGAAAILGYTNSDIGYADALQARGDKSTMSLGHSRGTLVQTNSFDILNERGFTNEQLSARGVGGAIGVDRYTESATSAGAKDRNVAFNYFANDPVAVIAGGNPGNTGISTLRDLWTVMTGGPNTQHSCYGTGAPGCKQVETPVHGGPQGTPEGNALLIEYQSGERVDKNPVARDLQERAR